MKFLQKNLQNDYVQCLLAILIIKNISHVLWLIYWYLNLKIQRNYYN